MTPEASLPPGRQVELPGLGRTFVRDLPGPPGAPTVVLLHGLLATADLNWSSSYTALGRHFRVVALDHRGHAQGIRSHRRFRLEDCADDVATLADQLGLRTFVPVGYSMGGTIAQLVWRRHPHRVDGLVLCATSRNFRGRPGRRFVVEAPLAAAHAAVRLTPSALRHRLLERVMGRRAAASPRGEMAWSEFRRHAHVKLVEAVQALWRYTSHTWIGAVDVPTAVVVTGGDRLVHVERQRKLAAAVPGAAVLEVDGDHAIGIRKPDRFVPVLVEACLHVTGDLPTGVEWRHRELEDR